MMDDVRTIVNDISEAKTAVSWLVESFEAGRFPLNTWATNSKESVRHIQQTFHPATQIANDEGSYEFLGVPWNLDQDFLYIETNRTASGIPTKRKLLKGPSQLSDPLGQIASIAIGLKALLQTLWTQRMDWDDPLSGELEESYRTSVASLKFGPNIRLRRALFKNQRAASSGYRKELHAFADASLRAYGCIAYIRETRPNLKGEASVSFVMAKGRVAPLAGKWTPSIGSS